MKKNKLWRIISTAFVLYKAKGLRIDAVVVVTVRDMGTKKVPRNDAMLPSFFCFAWETWSFCPCFQIFLLGHRLSSTQLFFFIRDCLKLKQELGRHAVFHQNGMHDLVVKIDGPNYQPQCRQTPGRGFLMMACSMSSILLSQIRIDY